MVGFRHHSQNPRKDSLSRCNHASILELCSRFGDNTLGIRVKHVFVFLKSNHILFFFQILRRIGKILSSRRICASVRQCTINSKRVDPDRPPEKFLRIPEKFLGIQ